MKVFFRRIHLYLSLAAGAVILVACLTGAILVFEKDLQQAFNKERYFVAAGGQRLSIDSLGKAVRRQYPGLKITGVKLYSDPERSVEFNTAAAGKKKEGGAQAAAKDKPKAEQRQPGFTVFVNPYTGAVLEKYSYRETFFYQVFALHRWLLGGEGSVGKYIVGVSTFLFLFILVTGIILWWPRTRNILRQRLRIKWSAGWKRVNHDLHLVFGFYSAIFLFIIAFTGLAWSFEWFNKGIYTVTASPLKPPPPPKAVFTAGARQLPAQALYDAAAGRAGEHQFISLAYPKDSSEVFVVSVLPPHPVHENATDAYYYDPYSGAMLGRQPYAQRSLGARVRSVFKPIHTGSLWGWPTKLLAFLVCLFGVSFPITGTIMWLNRTRKRS